MSQQTKPIPEPVKQDTIDPALRHFDELPSTAQVRVTVVKSLLDVSSTTVWRLVKAGKLKTHKLTKRTTTFNVGQLRAFMNQNVEG